MDSSGHWNLVPIHLLVLFSHCVSFGVDYIYGGIKALVALETPMSLNVGDSEMLFLNHQLFSGRLIWLDLGMERVS